MSSFLFRQFTLLSGNIGSTTGEYVNAAQAKNISCVVLNSGNNVGPTLRFFYPSPFDNVSNIPFMQTSVPGSLTGNYYHFIVSGLPVNQIKVGVETSGTARTWVSIFEQGNT